MPGLCAIAQEPAGQTHTLEGMTRHPSPRRRGALAVLGALLVSGLALTGCQPAAPGEAPGALGAAAPPRVVEADALLADYDLDGGDVIAVVDELDRMPLDERPEGLLASVRPDAVVFTAGERQAQLAMPDALVYVSVAPYATQTHDCYFHSLTTCVGELQNAEIELTLTDDASGAVLLEGTRTTFDNGFTGIWVPRGIHATLTVTHEGMTGTVPISTVEVDGPTCITTLRLA